MPVETGRKSEGTMIVDEDFKRSPNGAEVAARRQETMAKEVDKRLTSWEPAVVLSYDFDNQRVDVLLKDHPDAPPERNVPIAGSGHRTQPLPAVEDVGVSAAYVGQLFYPQTDAENAWDRRGQQRPQLSGDSHSGFGPIFFAEEPTFRSESLPDFFDATSGADDHDTVGPDDVCFYDENGYICIKSDGTIVIRGNDVFIGSIDVSTSDYDDVDTVGTGSSDHVDVS